MRFIGSLAGLSGLGMSVLSLLIIYRSIADRSPWSILLVFLTLPLAVWGIYIAYLAWFRLSPIIVRQVCAILGIFCLSTISRLTGHFHDTSVFWEISLFILSLIAVYYGYSILSTYLNRLLFTEYEFTEPKTK